MHQTLMNKIVIANPRTFKLVEGKYNGQFGERAFSRAGPKILELSAFKDKMIQSNDFYTSFGHDLTFNIYFIISCSRQCEPTNCFLYN